MPSATDILALLAVMTDQLVWLAIAWHVAIIAVAAAVIAGWRPSARFAIRSLAAPALSVTTVAVVHGSPFNAISVGLLAVALVACARETHPVRPGPTWAVALGVGMILFALVYPHFVADPWYRALYAAPVGIVPCPTLALLAGVTLVAGGFGSRSVPGVLAVWTTFYAVFGVARLGVMLDVGLLAGLVGLVVLVVQRGPKLPTATLLRRLQAVDACTPCGPAR